LVQSKDFKRNFKVKIIGRIQLPHEDMIDFLHDFLVEYCRAEGQAVESGKIRETSFHDIQTYVLDQNKDRKEIELLVILGAHIFSRFLARGQPYIDGNKRTGFATLWLFLVINDCEINIDGMAYHRHDKQIRIWADKERPNSNLIDEIKNWIKKELKPQKA
jgi:prophage maintenance system killer protein